MTPVAGALVPGMPQLRAAEPAVSWKELGAAVEEVGERVRARGVETVLLMSTQWFTVLGHQVQCDARVAGSRTDENWRPASGCPRISRQVDEPARQVDVRRFFERGWRGRRRIAAGREGNRQKQGGQRNVGRAYGSICSHGTRLEGGRAEAGKTPAADQLTRRVFRSNPSFAADVPSRASRTRPA